MSYRPYHHYTGIDHEEPTVRSVKEFLEETRERMVSERNDSLLPKLICFVNWLIAEVKPSAVLNEYQEKELEKNTDWEFWCTATEEYKKEFLKLIQDFPR